MMEDKRISPDHKRRTVVSTTALSAAKNKIVAESVKKPGKASEKPPSVIPVSDGSSAKETKVKSSAKSKTPVKNTTPAADITSKATSKATSKVSPKATAKVSLKATADTSLPELNPILASGAREISVPLSAENIRAFSEYARLLKEWNEKMNLTNITDDKGIAIRHFIDSLTLVSHLEEETAKKGNKHLSLIDVGTGAGFPGIPLKVAMPSLEVTLLDSLRKRVGFLDAVCAALELKGITTVHARAEDAGLSKQYREKFDVATARAVASLPVLCEYCLPFVKVGGIFLAMKGIAEEEIETAKKAIVTLGGTLETLHHFTLPGTDMNRSIIVIRKVRATPAKYPRQAGKPEKEPII